MQRELPLPRFLGVVHLQPLPGAPGFHGDLAAVFSAACRDAEALIAGGVGGLIVENFGDLPFRPGPVDPETVAAMALAVERVRAVVGSDLPVGVNVLRNDARAALGLCAAAGANFLRVNVHTGGAHTDQGPLVGRADETLRVRRELFPVGPRPPLLADVHVKHASPMGDVPIGVAAQDTLLRGLADGLIVSGTGTGAGVDLSELAAVRAAVPAAPLWIGSGFSPERAAGLLDPATGADGAIVGTWLKRDGELQAPVDVERVRAAAACFG
jgi:membrane complex biogenesis BtpA family protein